MFNLKRSFIGILISLYCLSVNCQSYVVNEGNCRSKDWIIVWGGKPYNRYGYQFMVNQSKGYLDKYNVVYADYQIDYDKCLKIVQSRSGKISCVYGFSRGGYNAFNLIGKVRYVRLIDPLIPRDYNVDFSKSDVYMVYNPNVWDRDNAARLVAVSKKLGNKSLKVNMPHLDIPKYFFTNVMVD